MPTAIYDEFFFNDQRDASLIAAREVLPVALGYIPARSLLDVGCGVGTWVAAALQSGVSDANGVDGDYVPRDLLMIPPDRFQPNDLTRSFDLGRRFDLVISMEVAEHIPAVAADTFLENLTRHGDAILFSAAIPGQGGTNHINEQWPQYWEAKFARCGFRMFDLIRTAIWTNQAVPAFYRQNAYLYVRESALERYPALAGLGDNYPRPVAVVHPEVFTRLLNRPVRVRRMMHDLPAALRIFLRERIGKITGR
jgi:SAM-dependent methyltransferase